MTSHAQFRLSPFPPHLISHLSFSIIFTTHHGPRPTTPIYSFSMADSIRGEGLFVAHRALATLAQDPQRLDHARRRFEESPPPYSACVSHNSTLSQSPNPPSDEQQRREERKWQLKREHRASTPYEQFEAQRIDESNWIIKAREDGIYSVPRGTNYLSFAEEKVKKRWIDQGIWRKKWTHSWNGRPEGPWRHEEPLELESESEMPSEANSRPSLFRDPKKEERVKPKQPEVNSERSVAERLAAREREREASRPFHQFVYQVSIERERIQLELRANDAIVPESADINSRAYERVKAAWVKRGIWNRNWGVLPGMSWKHEQPLEEMLREEMGDDPPPIQADAPRGNGCGTGEAPRTWNIFAPAPHESNQPSGNLIQSPQDPPADIIPASLEEGGNAMEGVSSSQRPSRSCSPGASNQNSLSGSGNTCPPRNDQANQSPAASISRREPSVEGGNSQHAAHNALGPVHPSKVAKVIRRSGPKGTRGRPKAPKRPSEAQESSAGRDVPRAPAKTAPAQPRRSRRLQEAAEDKTTADIEDIAAPARRGRPKSKPANASAGSLESPSAKPQGVTKKRRTRRSRG